MFLFVKTFLFYRDKICYIAELRRPEELLSGAPYSDEKKMETHELIFSWLSWLAVLLECANARLSAGSSQIFLSSGLEPRITS